MCLDQYVMFLDGIVIFIMYLSGRFCFMFDFLIFFLFFFFLHYFLNVVSK